jgi:hypothetical protein
MYYCLVLSTTTLTNKRRRRVTVAVTMKTTRHDGGSGDAQTMSFTSFGLLVCFFSFIYLFIFNDFHQLYDEQRTTPHYNEHYMS